MNFNNIKEWIIPEGTVKEVKDSQNRVLWNKTPYIDYGYFYIEDITGEDNTIAIEKNYTTAPTIEVFYSTDQTNWTSMGNTDTRRITATIPANGKLYLKATTNQWGAYVNGNRYNRFSILNSVNVGGNIMSLLYGDNYNNKTEFPSGSVRNFYYLFSACNIVSAENLVLPATTLTDNCYNSMFQTCTYLVTTPELPATTLANSCYAGMFADCASLTTAPELPATTLAEKCYNTMFTGCTSLTQAPELPATTLAEKCYQSMFYGCTSLTTTPTLPATTLASNCYQNMFTGCTVLTTAPALPATTLANNCYQNMFQNCTSLTTTPALPATTLTTGCYYGMFRYCTSLTTAPVLPATTLANNSYNSMFRYCSNLNKVTTYAQDISANACLSTWLGSVSATGDFYNYGSAVYPSGSSGIPSGWTVHTSL